MAEPFVGEIRMFAGNFAPRGWAFCDGQLLAISQNDALFSLFGTTYGGDGRTTFGLPDLRGRIPIHAGQGPGLSERRLGARGGEEEVALTVNQLPGHNHRLQASSQTGMDALPESRVLAQSESPFYGVDEPIAPMSNQGISSTGGSQPHTNVMPYLCVHFIIALFGVYPSRH